MKKLAICVLVSLTAGLVSILAHMDPVGEVHPEVLVAGKQFQVFYSDNSLSRSNSPSAPTIFRRVFDDRGTMVQDSEVVQSDRIPQTGNRPRIALPEPLNGITHRFKQSEYIMPEWQRKHQRKPFYLVADDKRYIRKELQWLSTSIDIVQDFIVTEFDLVVLATKLKPDHTPSTSEVDLWIFHFDRSTGSIVSEKRLGDPTFIYNFPGTSKLSLTESLVRVVWNEAPKPAGTPILHLATYDVSTRILSDRPLPFASTWNISISIGVVSDVLCLAYHGVSPKLAIKFIDLRSN